VEALERNHVGGLVLNSLTHLGKNDEVVDDWGGKKRVLASVMYYQGVSATHEDLGSVFVHCPLAVTD